MRGNTLPSADSKNQQPRPSGLIQAAAEALVVGLVPFRVPVPTDRGDRDLWAARGLSVALTHRAIDALVAGGRLRIVPIAGSGLWVEAVAVAEAPPALAAG